MHLAPVGIGKTESWEFDWPSRPPCFAPCNGPGRAAGPRERLRHEATGLQCLERQLVSMNESIWSELATQGYVLSGGRARADPERHDDRPPRPRGVLTGRLLAYVADRVQPAPGAFDDGREGRML